MDGLMAEEKQTGIIGIMQVGGRSDSTLLLLN